MSESAIIARLVTLLEAQFTTVTFQTEPQTADLLRDETGTVAAVGYTLEELDFLQDRISYDCVALVRRAASSNSETVRSTLYTDLEAVRTAIQADPTLSGDAVDARVTGLQVLGGSGEPYALGVLEVSAVVIL